MSPRSIVAVLPHFLATESELHELVTAVLDQQGAHHCRVVIVANNPHNVPFDAIVDIPEVEILEPGLNMGYVGALEWVRRRSSAGFLWVLQEDIRPLPDCLERLVKAFDTHQGAAPLAVASPIEVDADGSNSDVLRIGKFNLDTGVGTAPTQSEREKALRPWVLDNGRTVTFAYLSGALIDCVSLTDVGGFDVNLWPLMAVDLDTCAALQIKGYAITLVGDARIRHLRATPRRYPRFHHWKETATLRNTQYLVAKYSDGAVSVGRHGREIPSDIAYALARSMSEFIMEYSNWVYRTSWRSAAWQAKRTLRRMKSVVANG